MEQEKMILGRPWKWSIHDRPAYRTYPTSLYRGEIIHLDHVETVFDKTLKNIYIHGDVVICKKNIYIIYYIYVYMGDCIEICEDGLNIVARVDLGVYSAVKSCIPVFLYVIDINGLWMTNLGYSSVVWGWWEKTTDLHFFFLNIESLELQVQVFSLAVF